MNTTHSDKFRVVCKTRTGFADERTDVSYPWIGVDLDELSRLYPPSNIFGADPLFHREIEDGFIRTDYAFERQLPDGSWEKIDDPRRRLTPMTDLERAIDAENRRDFPGDYDTSDDEDDYYGDTEWRYVPNCKHCDDRGCAKCVACTNCFDNGCADCEPQYVCKGCNRYFNPQYDEQLDGNQNCTFCATEAARRFCSDCKVELSNQEKGELCSNCEYDRTPKCRECNYHVPDGDDELCSDCRAELRIQRCFDCDKPHTDPTLTNDDLCQPCIDDYRRYYVWWRRLIRKIEYRCVVMRQRKKG